MKYSRDYEFLKYVNTIVIFTLFNVNNSLSDNCSQTIITKGCST